MKKKRIITNKEKIYIIYEIISVPFLIFMFLYNNTGKVGTDNLTVLQAVWNFGNENMSFIFIGLIIVLFLHFYIRKNTTFNVVEDIDYYRNLLDDLSPGMISMLMSLKFDYRRSVIASLLKLENNNNIIIKDGKCEVINEDMLNFVKQNKKYCRKNLFYWRDEVVDTLVSNNFIELKKGINILNMIISFIPIVIISLCIQQFEPAKNILGRMVVLYFIIWFCYWIARGKIGFIFKRLELGNKFTEKIYGLKSFINDFSNLSDANREKVKLWDDYLIYAVVLEENSKICYEIARKAGIDLNDLSDNPREKNLIDYIVDYLQK